MVASPPGLVQRVNFCMKPSHLILPLLGTMPVLSLVAVGAIPGIADARRPGFESMPERLESDPSMAALPPIGEPQLLASLPSSFRDKLWVRTRDDISLEQLASQLRVQETPWPSSTMSMKITPSAGATGLYFRLTKLRRPSSLPPSTPASCAARLPALSPLRLRAPVWCVSATTW